MATPDESATAPGASLEPANAAWLSVKDAAAALGVAPRTVRRRIERGQLAGKSVALDGGGRAWLVSLSDTETPANGQSAANRTDSERTARPIAQISVKSSERTASGQRAANRTDSERTANGQPIEREPTRREIEQQEEIRFLRGTVEQLQRDGAETRAALRAALKLAPSATAPQLTAGAASGDVAGGVAASNGAPDEQFAQIGAPTAKQPRAAPVTYDSIADELERNLKARGL